MSVVSIILIDRLEQVITIPNFLIVILKGFSVEIIGVDSFDNFG